LDQSGDLYTADQRTDFGDSRLPTLSSKYSEPVRKAGNKLSKSGICEYSKVLNPASKLAETSWKTGGSISKAEERTFARTPPQAPSSTNP